jgi:hypothetical protein
VAGPTRNWQAWASLYMFSGTSLFTTRRLKNSPRFSKTSRLRKELVGERRKIQNTIK